MVDHSYHRYTCCNINMVWLIQLNTDFNPKTIYFFFNPLRMSIFFKHPSRKA